MAGIVPIAGVVHAAPSDTAWHEGFEGPNPSWRASGADMEYRIDEHGRRRGGAHTGQASEQIRVTGSNGTYIYFSHPVPPSQITSELAPSVWIKADRPGLQILARIVLPNLIDPKTRQPAAVFVRGTSYSQVGIWQQLRIENVPLELERQLRVLRLQLARPDVDARGAFLDQVWLNVFGGPGTTNVAIDDLELSGIVDPALAPRKSDAASPIPFSREPIGERDPATTWAGTANGTRPLGRDIKLDGSVLLVDGHPFFPRILRYQGERLELVAKTGFNAIRLTQPPPPQLLADAERLGLWIVCPPPRGPAVQPGMPAPLAAEIGPEYDSVLAWHLGDGLTGEELSAVTAIARQLEPLDSRRKRPIVCAPETDLRAYSSRVNYLCFGRAPLGTSIELGDYMNWLRERPRLARPGTPFWTTVQTELSPAACEQAAMFSGSRPPIPADGESLRMLTYSALSAGARGIEFRLGSPLDTAPQSLQLELSLLNLELELAEPWAATGSYVTTAASRDQQIVGAVLQTQTTHLLLPMRVAPHSQYIPYLPEQAAHGPVTIVVPGIPEWHSAFELTPAGLLPLKHTRGTGGEHITIDDFQFSSMVLITADPAVIDTLTRRLTQMADRSAPLQRELTAQTLSEVEAIDRRLPHKPPEALPTEWLTKARAGLAEADKSLAAGDRPAAYQAARKAIGPLEQFKRYRWEQVLTGQNSLATSPFYVSFETLPDQWRLMDQLRYLQPGNNQLPGGDCENLGWMLQQNWKHVDLTPQADLHAHVELSTKQPHGGKSSLHLQVKPTSEDDPPALVETAPVWVTTPPISVQAHELLAIRGFARVPTQIAGSIDGLMILDSIGGESLAERIGQTNGWREFIMYRVAPRDGTFTVTFALTGLGDAWLDDISIAPVTRIAGNELGRLQPLPPVNGSLPVRR
ncbi:MAG TPA: hypothetical protein VGY55_12090 [Pirellulales bacterium]|nr:hypothetical protein [Pirellulales bacterium]